MSMGNNRDYKSNSKRVFRNLFIHKAMMDKLVADGMEREAADTSAYNSLMAKDEFYKSIAEPVGTIYRNGGKA